MTVSLRLTALVAALELSLRQQEAYHAGSPDILLQAVLIRRRLSTRASRKLLQGDVKRGNPMPVPNPTLEDLIEIERRIAQHLDQLLPKITDPSDLHHAMMKLRAEVDEASLSLRLIELRRSSYGQDADEGPFQ